MKAYGFAACLVALAPGLALAQEAAPKGKPANMCAELTAFLHPPAPAEAAPSTAPAQLATAVQASGSGKEAPKPSGDGDPQKSSGLSGQTASSGPGAAGPQGASQSAGSPSGASQPSAPPTQAAAAPPPAAPAAPPPLKPNAEQIALGDAAASANDIAACQGVARQMRRAGVVMPSPLISLAALDPRLLEAGR